MHSYKWNEKYEVGFKPMDNQHKSILKLINRIVKNRRMESRIIICLLNELLCYIQYHFKSEETYMMIYGYGEYEAHMVEHAVLVKDFLEIIDRYKKGRTDVEKVVQALVTWGIPHFIEVDKIVGRFLARAITG